MPVSQVNAIRREALERLAQKRIRAFEQTNSAICDQHSESALPAEYLPKTDIPPMAYVRTAEQAEAARTAGMRVIRCPEDYRVEAMEALKAAWHPGDWLKLPDVCEEDTLQALHCWTKDCSGVLGGIALGSVGQLGLDWPVPYGAGPAIPVMNRQAASLLFEEGCAFVTASPELTGTELKTLLADDVPIVTVVYGRQRLMLLHHCPARTALGLTKGHRDCRMCDNGEPDALAGQALEDRKGYRFPLLRQRLPEGCMVELMNALPTENISNAQSFLHNEEFKALVLTTEDAAETEEVLDAFREGRKTRGETTAGHWKRAVE